MFFCVNALIYTHVIRGLGSTTVSPLDVDALAAS